MLKTKTLFSDADDDWPPPDGEKINSGETTVTPTTYHNRTLASRAAAESARKFVRSQIVRVSEYIAAQGERGCTDKEIQTALNLDGNSERPRRCWLRDHGYIKAKGESDEIVLRDGSTVWVSVRSIEGTITHS